MNGCSKHTRMRRNISRKRQNYIKSISYLSFKRISRFSSIFESTVGYSLGTVGRILPWESRGRLFSLRSSDRNTVLGHRDILKRERVSDTYHGTNTRKRDLQPAHTCVTPRSRCKAIISERTVVDNTNFTLSPLSDPDPHPLSPSTPPSV